MPQIATAQQPAIRLLQITDTHLFADRSQHLLGINTYASLAALTQQIAQRLTQPVDALLLTGDLVQDHSPEGYEYVEQLTQFLAKRQFWLLGNHDERVVITQHPQGALYLQAEYVLGNWALLLLDSQVAGCAYGRLDTAQLMALEHKLANLSAEHVLLAVHHHCLPVGSAWIDQIGLRNADQLLALCAKYPQVKVIISGHVHQASHQQVAGLDVLTTPSSCVQFLPKAEDFAVDTLQPGYRWLTLYADGRVETHVERLQKPCFVPDPEAAGY